MNLLRAILLEIEKLPYDNRFHDVAVDGYDGWQITYHVMLLHEAGLIEAVDLSAMPQGVCWKPRRLTYQGHEFLDAARSDTVWEKAKSRVLAATGVLTLEALRAALSEVLRQLIAS